MFKGIFFNQVELQHMIFKIKLHSKFSFYNYVLCKDQGVPEEGGGAEAP